MLHQVQRPTLMDEDDCGIVEWISDDDCLDE